jgi:hypothetical protein
MQPLGRCQYLLWKHTKLTEILDNNNNEFVNEVSKDIVSEFSNGILDLEKNYMHLDNVCARQFYNQCWPVRPPVFLL